MRIYCRWLEIVRALRVWGFFIDPYPAHRWTAIGMGADRDHPAIGPLPTDSDPTST